MTYRVNFRLSKKENRKKGVGKKNMSEYRFHEESLKSGLEIPADVIGLPTKGAAVTAVEFVKQEEVMCPTGDFYRISGAIHPVDENAYDINFQMGFPAVWNGRLVQYGGNGLDGMVIPAESPAPGCQFMTASPMAEGYAVFSSDSGHAMNMADSHNCDWALNDEALENYAHKALKKNKDVAAFLIQAAYGVKPEKVYFAGGSNGGREALKAIENYPEDYDGVICLYPAQNFLAKILYDNHMATVMQELGKDAVISSERWHELGKLIIAHFDETDGAKDGLISDLSHARSHREEIRELLKGEVTELQLKALDRMATPYRLPFDLGNGCTVMPEHAIYEGTPVYEVLGGFPFCNLYGNNIESRDIGADADQVLKCVVMRDKSFDTIHIAPETIRDELIKATKLIDVNPGSIEAFIRKGGKIILLQGMSDPMITPYSTVQFFDRLVDRYGEEELRKSLRFFMVPGYGHGFCENYGMHTDLLAVISDWVEKGNAPVEIITTDGKYSLQGTTQGRYLTGGVPPVRFSM